MSVFLETYLSERRVCLRKVFSYMELVFVPRLSQRSVCLRKVLVSDCFKRCGIFREVFVLESPLS